MTEEFKYQCKTCDFQSNIVTEMYEHKLNHHPENPIEFTPTSTNTKEFILNFIAEQNVEIIEDIMKLKEDLKMAREEINSGKKEAKELNLKIAKLEHVSCGEKTKRREDPRSRTPPQLRLNNQLPHHHCPQVRPHVLHLGLNTTKRRKGRHLT